VLAGGGGGVARFLDVSKTLPAPCPFPLPLPSRTFLISGLGWNIF